MRHAKAEATLTVKASSSLNSIIPMEKEFFKTLSPEQSNNLQRNLAHLSLTRKYTQAEVDTMPEWVQKSLMRKLA